MIVEFIGATRTVTGSMHLLHINGKNILLDCGLFQGKRADTFERNKNFPFAPSSIDALILSHGHIDHAGNLPNLVKNGYDGPIYCTPATRDLCDIMLKDSAYIQERDVEFVGKKHKLEKIFLVHGDPDQAEKFSGGLTEQGFRNIQIPVRLQTFEV